ncbi:DUF3168 domain-containing protein [Paracoccus sp. YLB-12]|uniref:DUF3168 domain-containing protein n=1 Tax=Paracoccus maritimus TaxID=2933292 RepID=A0ABT2K7X4_9RHOB|nr:DUF3168 domain-containing protein [Paracoccus sp. YLB-12]MCT4332627.1 DUF3168 domain-containing protein [Paracoccus sp. YLB-12]
MIPSLALQGAVRQRLLSDPVISLLVAPRNIRAGDMRPTDFPAIVLSPTRTEILGRAAAGQIVAEVQAMLHVWVINDGSETGENIAASAFTALLDAPEAEGFEIDRWERPSLVWVDQAASVGGASHGAIALRATIRWRE